MQHGRMSYQSGLVQENERHGESERHRDTCTTQRAVVRVQRWPSAHERDVDVTKSRHAGASMLDMSSFTIYIYIIIHNI